MCSAWQGDVKNASSTNVQSDGPRCNDDIPPNRLAPLHTSVYGRQINIDHAVRLQLCVETAAHALTLQSQGS